MLWKYPGLTIVHIIPWTLLGWWCYIICFLQLHSSIVVSSEYNSGTFIFIKVIDMSWKHIMVYCIASVSCKAKTSAWLFLGLVLWSVISLIKSHCPRFPKSWSCLVTFTAKSWSWSRSLCNTQALATIESEWTVMSLSQCRAKILAVPHLPSICGLLL
jgi:hypothetical protein